MKITHEYQPLFCEKPPVHSPRDVIWIESENNEERNVLEKLIPLSNDDIEIGWTGIEKGKTLIISIKQPTN